MQAKLQQAKHLFKTKRYEECKELITSIIESKQINNIRHSKLLCKLGDIALAQGQIERAERYYLASKKENKNNPTPYLQLGKLFDEHWHNYSIADLMYQNLTNLFPTDANIFKYAQFKQKHNKIAEAQQLYTKCLTINNSLASVHYHLAVLYQSQTPDSDDDRIHHLFKRAIALKPNIAQYHKAYAQYLKNIHKYNRANQHYKTALQLIHNQDMHLLYEYYLFLSDRLCQKERALQYLHIAIALATDDAEGEYIIREYHSIRNNNTTDSNKEEYITLVLYRFESVITYNDLSTAINGDMKRLKQMQQKDIIQLFGGEDRIRRLEEHFNTLLNSRNNMRIIVFCDQNKRDIIKEALLLINFEQYFTQIIGSESFDSKQNVVDVIIDTKDEHRIFASESVLFIDCNETNIAQMKQECVTYHITKEGQNEIRGPTFDDLEWIEKKVANENALHYSSKPKLADEESKQSLSEIETDLYHDIKSQIAQNTGSIHNLAVVQWIHQNWTVAIGRDLFIYFAEKYQQIRMCTRDTTHGDWWSACLLLQDVLKYETKDCELYGLFAKCLSRMKHEKSADLYFKLAFEHDGDRVIKIVTDYAFHSLFWRKYKTAEVYFKKAMNLHANGKKHTANDLILCYGLARALSGLNETNEAQMYFELGLKKEAKANRFYEPIHSSYALFLRKQGRFAESKKEYELLIKHNPNKASYECDLSKVLCKLYDFDGHLLHLLKSVALDPNSSQARNQNKDTYRKPHVEQKKKAAESVALNDLQLSCYAIKFDNFWFDTIAMESDDKRFNEYYDRLCQRDMNDIRWVAYNKYIERDLKNKIGVSDEDRGKIMGYVHEFRKDVIVFTNWMKQNNFYSFYRGIFHKYAIYTFDAFDYKIKTQHDLEAMVVDLQTNEEKSVDYKSLVQQFWRKRLDRKNSVKP